MADPSFAMTLALALLSLSHMIGKLQEKRPRGHQHISRKPQVRTQNHLLHQNFPNLIYISARLPKDTTFISLRPRYRRGEPPMPISGRDTYCACACGLDCSASRGVTINSEPTAFSFLHSCRHHISTAGQLYTFERSSHVGNM